MCIACRENMARHARKHACTNTRARLHEHTHTHNGVRARGRENWAMFAVAQPLGFRAAVPLEISIYRYTYIDVYIYT